MDKQVVERIYDYIEKLMRCPRSRHQIALDLLQLMDEFGVSIDLQLINAIARCLELMMLKH